MEGLVLSDDLSRLEQNSCETIQQIFPESSTCLIDDGDRQCELIGIFQAVRVSVFTNEQRLQFVTSSSIAVQKNRYSLHSFLPRADCSKAATSVFHGPAFQ